MVEPQGTRDLESMPEDSAGYQKGVGGGSFANQHTGFYWIDFQLS